jgi:DNA repair protein RecN (Recombination protein N)
MLKSIYIDNYALIERLEIQLSEGLSIVTGETGAGKSILLGALGLLLGRRADTTVLRSTGRKCVVEGVFLLEGYHLEPFFENNELDYHQETIIRREITSNSKSRAFINDTPVTLELLQNLTLSLIDIHSQYQNLSLNSDSYLRWIIDCYAGLNDEIEEYRRLYLEYSELRSKYYEAREAFRADSDNYEFMNHRFNELQAAKLINGELSQLEEEYSILDHAEDIKQALGNSIQLMSEDEHSVIAHLRQVGDLIARIRDHYPSLSELIGRLESTYIEIKDIAAILATLFEKVEFDPGRLEHVNSRLDILNTLLHKYKVRSEEELITIRDELDEKLRQFSVGDIELGNLSKALAEKETETLNHAKLISDSRKRAFIPFASGVQQLLITLGMKNARFSVQHEQLELSDTGIDKIQFLFSANNNTGLQPVARVASGGELSRLMLTIKYLISTTSGLPSIIFDEIDTGVSGEIADKVGKLIKEMAANMQVINITHLPQVASKGDQHYLVYKETENGTTITRIKQLDRSERLNEIARMLSGDSVTDAAIENAKVLLGI